MSKYSFSNIAIAVKETWYVPAIAIIMVLMALAGIVVLETHKSNIKDNAKNSKNNLKPRRKTFEAFAESYDLTDTETINPSGVNSFFEENRPKQLIAPESFGKTYDYYIDNLQLYFADEEGKIYQIPTKGMAVKIGSPVLSVVYLSTREPNQVSDGN